MPTSCACATASSASLELLRSGSFDTAFGRIAIDMTGRGLDELSDDAAIDAWLMETIGDTGHICGTCRMGAPDDPRTVVDPEGRVLGVESLWVADASVFPAVPASQHEPADDRGGRAALRPDPQDDLPPRAGARGRAGVTPPPTPLAAARRPAAQPAGRHRARQRPGAGRPSGRRRRRVLGRLAAGGAAMLIGGRDGHRAGVLAAARQHPGGLAAGGRRAAAPPGRRDPRRGRRRGMPARAPRPRDAGRRQLLLARRPVGDPLAARADRPARDARARGRRRSSTAFACRPPTRSRPGSTASSCTPRTPTCSSSSCPRAPTAAATGRRCSSA